MTIKGTKHNDHLKGTSHNDIFVLSQGGDDSAKGLGGNDTFRFGGAFTAGDHIDGAAGNDTLSLAGNYSGSHKVVFGAATMVGVETIKLAAGHSYTLTTNDANVGNNKTLTVNGGSLGASAVLTFNGAHETNGHFNLIGGAANDVLTGGHQSDTFNLTHGGNDVAKGGAGNDVFTLGAKFSAADHIDGGLGDDTVTLNGDYYTTFVPFDAATMVNVETIVLTAGFSYSLATSDATVASGATLTVDGHTLASTQSLIFDGSLETNGALHILGGAGNDLLLGGAGNDVIGSGDGNNGFDLSTGGNDVALGGAGDDTFNMGHALTAGDTITGAGGDNTIVLAGDYSGGVTLSGSKISAIGRINMFDGGDYVLTTDDALVAFGQGMLVDASLLGSGHTLNFDASAETDGTYHIIGGAGNDVMTGGTGDDTLDLYVGGNDTATGGGGSDTFSMGGALTSADTIDGGGGTTDFVLLNGDYSAGITLGASTLTHIEDLVASGGSFSYKFTTAEATIASGATLEVDGTAIDSSHSLTVDASAETDGKLSLFGGAGNDTFTVANVSVFTNSFFSGGSGGTTDTLVLNADFSSDTFIGSTQLANIDRIVLTAGRSYYLQDTGDAVTGGNQMVIDASALSAGNIFTFRGSSNTSGSYDLIGGAGNEDLQATIGNDVVDISHGGTDTIVAFNGDDTINAGAAFDLTDQIDGGSGLDIINLNGDYSAGLSLGATTLVAFEDMIFAAGHSYTFVMNDSCVSSSYSMTVDANALGVADVLNVNGSAETNGTYAFIGGAGNDVMVGGAGNDNFNLVEGGTDTMTGGGGIDVFDAGFGDNIFIYNAVSESTSTNHDIFFGFDANQDQLDLTFSVLGLDARSGSVSFGAFDSDLATAVGSMGAHHVAVVTASGSYNNHILLVADANGSGAYEANSDYVFDLNGGVTGTISLSNFI